MKEKSPAILTTREGERVEYKREVNPRIISKEIVAFANTCGGIIKIGVEDDGTVVGADLTMADTVSNVARTCCEPPLAPMINSEMYNDKIVITVTVNPGPNPPYRTSSGIYYVRVGATVQIASLSEIIDLIVKGPYKDMILHKIKIPLLRNQIRTSMKAEAEKQTIIGIIELSEIAQTTTDASIKLEVVDIVDELMNNIPCSNDRVIMNLVLLLAKLVLINLARDPNVLPQNQKIVGQVINILKHALRDETLNPKLTNRTEYILYGIYLTGLGCIWAKYDDQFHEIRKILNSICGIDRKLDKHCCNMIYRLAKCAEEEPTYSPRRLAMLIEPYMDGRPSPFSLSKLKDLIHG